MRNSVTRNALKDMLGKATTQVARLVKATSQEGHGSGTARLVKGMGREGRDS